VEWNPARPTGYGAVPGYRPPALGSGASIALSSAWRGRWVDITGLYSIGLRPYDPVSGRWLTYDSVFDERNPNGFSAFGGDPINGFDSDGRCVETGLEKGVGTIQNLVGGAGQMGAIGYDMVAQTAWAAGGSGGEYQGVSDLYQNIYQNPSAGPTADSIASGTLNVEANVATLGIYGMASGFYTGITTGDYSDAQSASLTALMMAPGASQLSGVLNGTTSTAGDLSTTLNSGATVPANTITLPDGLMDEAARLQAQWPEQMQALQDSGQPLNMGSPSSAAQQVQAGGQSMSGPVYVKPPPNATSAQVAQVQAYVNGANQARLANALSPTGRVPTAGTLRNAASQAAAAERAAAQAAGIPYQGAVGHVPDTTWTGNSQPYMWLDLDPTVNSSIGGQANAYPIGYQPTEFIYGQPPDE